MNLSVTTTTISASMSLDFGCRGGENDITINDEQSDVDAFVGVGESGKRPNALVPPCGVFRIKIH